MSGSSRTFQACVSELFPPSPQANGAPRVLEWSYHNASFDRWQIVPETSKMGSRNRVYARETL